MSRALKIILTFFWGILTFIFFLLLFFPLDPIFNHVLAGVENQTGGQCRIAVGQMEPSLIFDSVFKDVTISRKTADGFDDFLHIDKMDVDVSLFSLITKTINVDFNADFADGTVVGNLKTIDEKTQLDLKLNHVRLALIPGAKDPLSNFGVFFQPTGEIEGEAFLAFSKLGLRDLEAELNLRIKTLKLKNAQVRLSPDPGVKPIEVGDLELSDTKEPARLQLNLVNGQMRLQEFTVLGADVKVDLKGKLSLKEEKNDKITIVRTDVKGRLGLSEKIGEALPILSLLDAQKDADGFYPITIAGRAEKPSFKIGEMDIGALLGAPASSGAETD